MTGIALGTTAPRMPCLTSRPDNEVLERRRKRKQGAREKMARVHKEAA